MKYDVLNDMPDVRACVRACVECRVCDDIRKEYYDNGTERLRNGFNVDRSSVLCKIVPFWNPRLGQLNPVIVKVVNLLKCYYRPTASLQLNNKRNTKYNITVT